MSTVEIMPVIFRMSAGEVTAVFPTEPCNSLGDVTVYAQIGQHGGAAWSWYHRTRKASPTQYADLLRELRGIYESDGDCLLQVYERVTRTHRRQFGETLRRLRITL